MRAVSLPDQVGEPSAAAGPETQAGTLGLVALGSGRQYALESNRAVSDVVATFDAHADAIGVLVLEDGRFVGVMSKDALALFLSRPYTQFLYLHRPIAHLLNTWHSSPLECPDDMEVSEVIAMALQRPVASRYEPVVACGSDGVRRLVDVHSLLVQQNRMLENTQTSLEQQRAATQKAEREREELHARLLEASRNAGRAEVATGILHNVGNVLNSVSVSRAMISRKLEQSKVANLGRAVALLIEHSADLAGFLGGDRRGQELPRYLAKVAEVLSAEHAFMLAEMKELGENLEHIKQVVVTQQSYARARAVVQDVRPVDLMDDAARMNIISFERHNVTVERRYSEVGTVQMDRHKVLQILINLISNAKNALKKAGAPDRRIVLTVTRSNEASGAVQFVVEDNGVGIASEHLTRIFSHGFTTRREGHGFGLHSSANFARELGGRLTVESPGRGLGARFTLELPVTMPAVRGAA